MSGKDSGTVLCYFIDQLLSAGTNFSLVMLSHCSINIVTLVSSQIVSSADCLLAPRLAESVWFHGVGLLRCAANCMSVFTALESELDFFMSRGFVQERKPVCRVDYNPLAIQP